MGGEREVGSLTRPFPYEFTPLSYLQSPISRGGSGVG
jgi:hypothetical protein